MQFSKLLLAVTILGATAVVGVPAGEYLRLYVLECVTMAILC